MTSNLLSACTAKDLQLLQVNALRSEVDLQNKEIDLDSEMKHRFPESFQGVGKLKDTLIKLHIDPKWEAVAQPVRRG